MEAIWEQVKVVVRQNMPAHSYRMWIEPVQCQRNAEDGITLLCPNQFYKKRILDHYMNALAAALESTAGRPLKLRLAVADRPQRIAPVDCAPQQLPLPDIHQASYTGRILRRNFTFDQFVVSDNNGFAYSAALALASTRRTQQNALFLLSNTGNGKSHLSQAIGHHILSGCPGERVYYITAEDFANEMIAAFQNNTITAFKEKYRNNCDVLLIEDVHYLSGKDRTQVELALTLDALYEADKKIIFSSCYLPGDIPKLHEKLQSRLACGIISTIDPPNFQTRVKILKKKAGSNGYHMPEEVFQYLAGELSENVRQLESGLIGVAAKSALLGSEINLDLAESVVKNFVSRRKRITIDAIKKVICKYYNVTHKELVSRSRKQRIVRPRQVAIYLARKYTDQPLQAIGKNFNRYHATALHAINVVEKGIKNDMPLQKHVEFISRKLENGDY